MDTIHTNPQPSSIEVNVSPGETTKPIHRRRRHHPAFKRQVVEESLSARESVSVVARRHDLNANQVFKWRQLYRQGLLTKDADEQSLIPVSVSSSLPPLSPDQTVPRASPGQMEIVLANGHRLIMTGSCPKTLHTALSMLLAC